MITFCLDSTNLARFCFKTLNKRMKAIFFNNVGLVSIATSRPTIAATCLFSVVHRAQPSLIVPKANMKLDHQPNIRRSGNYKPTMWDFQYIQSVNNRYAVSILFFFFNFIGRYVGGGVILLLGIYNRCPTS